MESRKYQLQNQIREALKSNNSDLYSLLKSQWAHRYGVESLEELRNLNLKEPNQNSTDLNNQIIDQSKENSFEVEKVIHKKVDDQIEKEIKNKELESVNNDQNESLNIKSYEIVNNEKLENTPQILVKQKTSNNDIKALIPLPPKPRYSYLKKWLIRK